MTDLRLRDGCSDSLHDPTHDYAGFFFNIKPDDPRLAKAAVTLLRALLNSLESPDRGRLSGIVFSAAVAMEQLAALGGDQPEKREIMKDAAQILRSLTSDEGP